MSQPEKPITKMLQYIVNRCAAICRNLNAETFGHERGPDCARKIEEEADKLIQETLDVNKPTFTPVVAQSVQSDPMANPVMAAGLTAILSFIEQGADELLVRRIWDEARRAMLQVELQEQIRNAQLLTWLGSEEGKKSMADAIATANLSIEELNKERRVDPALLHQPFGMEHDINKSKT